MPRYAIKQARALHTVYFDCDDVIDAVHHARAALVDHAKHCELEITRLRDPVYDERDAESDARRNRTRCAYCRESAGVGFVRLPDRF